VQRQPRQVAVLQVFQLFLEHGGGGIAVAVQQREAAAGSRASTVFMIDRIGVMPLPPAMPSTWRPSAGSTTARRSGPAAPSPRSCRRPSALVQPVRERAAGHARTPTRSSPSSAPAQIEYERRRSCPSCWRSVRYWPWVEAEDVAQLGRHVEGHDHRLVGVGRTMRARAGVEVQSAHDGQDEWSDRLEVFEGLAAGQAAVQRLAGGGAEGRQPLGVRAAAARAGDGRGPAWMRIGARAVGGAASRAAGRCRTRAACAGRRR
jgi:hypothetical protein